MIGKTQTVGIEDAFKEHERFLWGLCYRMTGNAADADDLVQETFIRAINHPPPRTDLPWRPWLVRVAINLGRDLLRKRKRQAYDGPWLPSPVETGDAASAPSYDPVDEHANPAARYDLLESVSFAFLLALEMLTPKQRAVLLLRDVFDYSVKETAEALDMTEQNVKTTHHRARHVMAEYDKSRSIPTRSLQEKKRHVLERFLNYLGNNDVSGVEALLSKDVKQLSDGGGEFIAARVPIIGREKILLFYSRLNTRLPGAKRHEIRMFNGSPAIITEILQPLNKVAPRTVTLIDLDDDGRIERIHVVAASRKLTAVT